jgi:uncharacterized protein YaaR (DUF327 family)
MDNIQAKKQILKEFLKEIIKRIKTTQEDIKNAYTQEDVYCYNAVERELINLKISLEKKIKHLT